MQNKLTLRNHVLEIIYCSLLIFLARNRLVCILVYIWFPEREEKQTGEAGGHSIQIRQSKWIDYPPISTLEI